MDCRLQERGLKVFKLPKARKRGEWVREHFGSNKHRIDQADQRYSFLLNAYGSTDSPI